MPARVSDSTTGRRRVGNNGRAVVCGFRRRLQNWLRQHAFISAAIRRAHYHCQKWGKDGKGWCAFWSGHLKDSISTILSKVPGRPPHQIRKDTPVSGHQPLECNPLERMIPMKRVFADARQGENQGENRRNVQPQTGTGKCPTSPDKPRSIARTISRFNF